MAVLLAAALPGCKIIEDADGRGKGRAGGRKRLRSCCAEVDAIWQSQAVPDLARSALAILRTVMQAAASNADAAGAKYGNPRKQSTSPWTYAAKAQRQDRRRRHGSPAQQRSTSMSTATARPMRRFRSARPCAARRYATCLTSWTSTNSTNQIDCGPIRQGVQHLCPTKQSCRKLPREGLDGRTAAAAGSLCAGKPEPTCRC